ncbi:staygreen family protein [Virgibacillus sp. JSM 102003]|uniref:staygreen family protein n=1 Tax=Virgibacillus sp. JSM 102003 TaxID=1562108 RepID=UPI0035BEC90D
MFNPDKLYVEFREGVTATEPIIHRRYTLTHSDITAELFLTIGLSFAWDKIGPMRDEVLGEWTKIRGSYVYNVYLDVDGQSDQTVAAIRNDIFRRELPLALKAIRYGDRRFFISHPELNNSPIIVYFKSQYPELNKVENWVTFAEYTNL